MNEQLFYDIGQQRYNADLVRAERIYAQRAAFGIVNQSARDRIALGLVTLATKLQPSLTIQVQRPADAATV